MRVKLAPQQLRAERDRYAQELLRATDPDARRVAEARLAEIDAELARRNGAVAAVHPQNPWPQVPLIELIRASGCTVSPKDEDESKYEGDHAAAHGSKSGRCLVVWAAEGRWHCTSCRQGGDAADWVAQHESVSREDAIARLVERYGPSPALLRGSPYRMTPGGLARVERVSDAGQETVRPVTNFIAWAVEERVLDDGAETTREYVLMGRLDSGHALPAVRVPATSFDALEWASKLWGIRARVLPGQREHARYAIQLLSQHARIRTAYAHAGWRHLPEHGWVFLHARGALGAAGAVEGVETALPPQLQRYWLPDPPSSPEDRRAAGAALLRFLEIGPATVTVPLLAATLTALLTEALGAGFTVWLLGPTGSWKSTLQALLSHLVGGPWDDKTPPTSWEATENALERLGFAAKDLPLWVDDFRPTATPREATELERRAQRFIREAANGVGRDRMRSDTTLRPALWPRCLALSSGELLPGGTSTIARVLVVEVDRARLDRERLTAAQAEAAHWYPQAGAVLVQALADAMDSLKRDLPPRRDALRDALFDRVGHPQHALHAAKLLLALGCWLDLLTECGALHAARASELLSQARDVVLGIARRTGEYAGEERPGRRFLDLVQTLLRQGRAHLRPLAGTRELDAPRDPVAWGWPRAGDAPTSPCLGWVDEAQGLAYLVPTATLREVAEYSRNLPRKFLVSQEALGRDLDSCGLLARKDEGRLLYRRRIGAERHYVWALSAADLRPERAEDAQDAEGDDVPF